MSTHEEHKQAEFLDRFMRRTAIGVFLVSLAFASSALSFVVGKPLAFSLDKLELGLGLLAVIIVFPPFVKMIRRKFRDRSAVHDSDGFVADAYKRAAEKGFSLTFVFLLFMVFVSGRYFPDLPAVFFINVILAFSLGIFSITFFRRLHSNGDDASDDEFEADTSL